MWISGLKDVTGRKNGKVGTRLGFLRNSTEPSVSRMVCVREVMSEKKQWGQTTESVRQDIGVRWLQGNDLTFTGLCWLLG